MTTVQESKLEKKIEGTLLDARQDLSMLSCLPPASTIYKYKTNDGREEIFMIECFTWVTSSRAKKGDKINIHKFSDGKVIIEIKDTSPPYTLMHCYEGNAKSY